MKQARIKIFSSLVLLAISVFYSFGYSQSNGRGGWDGENGKLRNHTRIDSMFGICARSFSSPECDVSGLTQCIDEAINAVRAEESHSGGSQSPGSNWSEVAGNNITDSERRCFERALTADSQIPN